eukprot:CAMPEP_0194480792 /NCGR_PEP_ID=MMETSP0253-20130528/3472_1 /TAXON_ID=2966 /ORGANISM="Noctiluca scintillans" /LENGTH=565 /DNA_ID=CAMNT_0039320221 /DNA_START=37 /DNA_END=1734 /DNA_ORIENTATION=+
MGSCPSACLSSPRETKVPTTRVVTLTVDPRWDVEGFNTWADSCKLGWFRVGYLRELHELRKTIPYRHLAPEGSLFVGAPPTDVSLYSLAPFTWLGEKRSCGWDPLPAAVHPDPDGFILARAVQYLNQDSAFDDDLVFFFPAATFLHWTCHEDMLCYQKYISACTFLMTHHRIKSIAIAEVPESYTDVSVMGRLWGIHEFHVAAFCQRIVNSAARLVKPNLTPEKLRNASGQLKSAPTAVEADRQHVLRLRTAFFSRMPAAQEDSTGFHVVCEQSSIRWVRVWFIHELASRGGPAPRCQDMPYGSFLEGRVPVGVRHYVVSHSWAANRHFDPSGEKLRDLAKILTRVGAQDNDVAFLDYMSLTQAGGWVPMAYLQYNPSARRHAEAYGLRVGVDIEERRLEQEPDMVRLSGRSDAQERRFRFARFETTRLYAFRDPSGPTVIVLPSIEPAERFPGSGEITWEENTVCQPSRREQCSSWGFSKSIAYEESGWPCAEYAVARMNGTIANGDDHIVRQVEQARRWPEDVEAYGKDLMSESAERPVTFTNKGDREAVRFNFYKYCFRVTE